MFEAVNAGWMDFGGRRENGMHLLDVLTILVTVSMFGTEFTVSVILNPALGRLDQATWLKTMPVLARAMGRAMPFWYMLGFLFIGVDGYLHLHAASRWWFGIAELLWGAGIVYSVTMLVPINNRIAAADTSATSQATAAEHKRWDALHRWRVPLLLVSATCLLIGVM
jgi:Anthrone oxygenase